MPTGNVPVDALGLNIEAAHVHTQDRKVLALSCTAWATRSVGVSSDRNLGLFSCIACVCSMRIANDAEPWKAGRRSGQQIYCARPHASRHSSALQFRLNRERHLERGRKLRIAAAISSQCVSRAKWPVSKKRTSASGMSRLNASAPGGRKNGSFLPQAARNGGLCLRK